MNFDSNLADIKNSEFTEVSMNCNGVIRTILIPLPKKSSANVSQLHNTDGIESRSTLNTFSSNIQTNANHARTTDNGNVNKKDGKSSKEQPNSKIDEIFANVGPIKKKRKSNSSTDFDEALSKVTKIADSLLKEKSSSRVTTNPETESNLDRDLNLIIQQQVQKAKQQKQYSDKKLKKSFDQFRRKSKYQQYAQTRQEKVKQTDNSMKSLEPDCSIIELQVYPDRHKKKNVKSSVTQNKVIDLELEDSTLDNNERSAVEHQKLSSQQTPKDIFTVNSKQITTENDVKSHIDVQTLQGIQLVPKSSAPNQGHSFTQSIPNIGINSSLSQPVVLNTQLNPTQTFPSNCVAGVNNIVQSQVSQPVVQGNIWQNNNSNFLPTNNVQNNTYMTGLPVVGQQNNLVQQFGNQAIVNNPMQCQALFAQGQAQPSFIQNSLVNTNRNQVVFMANQNIPQNQILGQTQTFIPNQVTGNQIISNPVAGNQIISNPVAEHQIISNPVAGNQIISNPVAGNQIFSNPVAGNQIISNLVAGNQLVENQICMNPVTALPVLNNFNQQVNSLTNNQPIGISNSPTITSTPSFMISNSQNKDQNILVGNNILSPVLSSVVGNAQPILNNIQQNSNKIIPNQVQLNDILKQDEMVNSKTSTNDNTVTLADGNIATVIGNLDIGGQPHLLTKACMGIIAVPANSVISNKAPFTSIDKPKTEIQKCLSTPNNFDKLNESTKLNYQIPSKACARKQIVINVNQMHKEISSNRVSASLGLDPNQSNIINLDIDQEESDIDSEIDKNTGHNTGSEQVSDDNPKVIDISDDESGEDSLLGECNASIVSIIEKKSTEDTINLDSVIEEICASSGTNSVNNSFINEKVKQDSSVYTEKGNCFEDSLDDSGDLTIDKSESITHETKVNDKLSVEIDGVNDSLDQSHDLTSENSENILHQKQEKDKIYIEIDDASNDSIPDANVRDYNSVNVDENPKSNSNPESNECLAAKVDENSLLTENQESLQNSFILLETESQNNSVDTENTGEKSTSQEKKFSSEEVKPNSDMSLDEEPLISNLPNLVKVTEPSNNSEPVCIKEKKRFYPTKNFMKNFIKRGRGRPRKNLSKPCKKKPTKISPKQKIKLDGKSSTTEIPKTLIMADGKASPVISQLNLNNIMHYLVKADIGVIAIPSDFVVGNKVQVVKMLAEAEKVREKGYMKAVVKQNKVQYFVSLNTLESQNASTSYVYPGNLQYCEKTGIQQSVQRQGQANVGCVIQQNGGLSIPVNQTDVMYGQVTKQPHESSTLMTSLEDVFQPDALHFHKNSNAYCGNETMYNGQNILQNCTDQLSQFNSSPPESSKVMVNTVCKLPSNTLKAQIDYVLNMHSNLQTSDSNEPSNSGTDMKKEHSDFIVSGCNENQGLNSQDFFAVSGDVEGGTSVNTVNPLLNPPFQQTDNEIQSMDKPFTVTELTQYSCESNQVGNNISSVPDSIILADGRPSKVLARIPINGKDHYITNPGSCLVTVPVDSVINGTVVIKNSPVKQIENMQEALNAAKQKNFHCIKPKPPHMQSNKVFVNSHTGRRKRGRPPKVRTTLNKICIKLNIPRKFYPKSCSVVMEKLDLGQDCFKRFNSEAVKLLISNAEKLRKNCNCKCKKLSPFSVQHVYSISHQPNTNKTEPIFEAQDIAEKKITENINPETTQEIVKSDAKNAFVESRKTGLPFDNERSYVQNPKVGLVRPMVHE